jgi:hypothetical protein
LPSGKIVPGYSIPHLCRAGLGLDHTCFSSKAPLRLVAVGGRGGEEHVFYYSGVLESGLTLVDSFESKISYLAPSELESFIPTAIDNQLI